MVLELTEQTQTQALPALEVLCHQWQCCFSTSSHSYRRNTNSNISSKKPQPADFTFNTTWNLLTQGDLTLYILLLFPFGPSGSPSPSPWWRRCRSLLCSWVLFSWWPASPGCCGRRSARRPCGSGGTSSSRSATACMASWTWCASVSPAFLILTLLVGRRRVASLNPGLKHDVLYTYKNQRWKKVFTFCT